MRYLNGAALAVVLSFSAAPAFADTVYSNSLANVNGSVGGDGQATTTTGATGTRTTVTGSGGDANRLHQTVVADTWQQQNVGGGGSVGITTDHARSGNGSLSFGGVDGNSKADAELYFSTAIPLSSLSSLSYDVYRDGSSTNPAAQTESLRLVIGNADGNYLGYLIFEPVYNGTDPIPVDQWLHFDIDGSSTFWSNNNTLSKDGGVAACPDCYMSLDQWQADNSGATIIGLSTGSGSGFNGLFKGAVDNISITAGRTTQSWNFEVATPTPEPATWAMMIAGFGVVGGALRRRRTTVRFA